MKATRTAQFMIKYFQNYFRNWQENGINVFEVKGSFEAC